jgi:hypothetical protein
MMAVGYSQKSVSYRHDEGGGLIVATCSAEPGRGDGGWSDKRVNLPFPETE